MGMSDVPITCLDWTSRFPPPPPVFRYLAFDSASCLFLFRYRSKALSMFQRVDGVEVCLFSMYVQEYGADAPYFNARRAYISYLDSGENFRL